MEVFLYGSEACHKTNYYKSYLTRLKVDFTFYDVIKNDKAADELRGLYETGRLNFPTILLGDKKLRNPSDSDLEKWLLKKGLITLK